MSWASGALHLIVVLLVVWIHLAIADDTVAPRCYYPGNCDDVWVPGCKELSESKEYRELCSSFTVKGNRDCVSQTTHSDTAYCKWDQGTLPKYPITSADKAFTVASLLCELYTSIRLLTVAFLSFNPLRVVQCRAALDRHFSFMVIRNLHIL